jgi:hypothetical protein
MAVNLQNGVCRIMNAHPSKHQNSLANTEEVISVLSHFHRSRDRFS